MIDIYENDRFYRKESYENYNGSFMEYYDEVDDDITHSMVKAVVSIEDDTCLPVLTFRFWLYGTICLIIHTINITMGIMGSIPIMPSHVTLLMAFPIGNLMAKYLPEVDIGFGEYSLSLNPGPFNIKEHSAIAIYIGLPFAINDLIVLYLHNATHYDSSWSTIASILLIGFSSILGIGFQTIIGAFMVKSPDMIFPTALVLITLIRSLHDKPDSISAKKIPRIKFVLIVALFSGIYHIIPEIFIGVMKYLSILCYVFPNNKIAHQLFSGLGGLGIGSISLCWNTITNLGAMPLITPLWCAVNVFAGFVITAWILTPILYYSNILNFGHFQIYARRPFDMYGAFYAIDLVIDENKKLDVQKYLDYSPMKLNVSVFLAYFFSFAGVVALLVHFLLYHTGDLMVYMQKIIIERKQSVGGFGDIHNKLMEAYKKVPLWWSFLLIAVSTTCGLIGCQIIGGEVTWYIYIFSIAIGITFFFPVAIVYAVSTIKAQLAIIPQAFVGYIYPGRPMGNLAGRTFSETVLWQAVQSAENFKIGHYMKLPPKYIFFIQIFGTFLSVVISIITVKFTASLDPDLCMDYSKSWNCAKIKTVFSSSSIWGLFGPSELFNYGREYFALWLSIIVGAITPVIVYALSKCFQGSWVEFIHVPIIFISAYNHAWWNRYNYLLSAGLDFGSGITITILSLLGGRIPTFDWAGNDFLGGCSRILEPYLSQ
ncbi:hypothetical protein BB561_002502 [Smittium simulii]|uniref:OPT family small oligopeptide transporter n=1 Tax=Smittium simulii TaxID=133385 RepID=A0A2T9YQA5_9FUNG|nr:hypothetical protein BB561_002502 [Smittium simulii]